MPSQVHTVGKHGIASSSIDLEADDVRAALLMTNTTAHIETGAGIDSIIDFTTLDEFDGGSYNREALTGRSVAVDTINKRAEFKADNLVFAAITEGTRKILGVLLYKHVTTDADHIPIAFIQFAVVQLPDETDFTVTWANGVVLQLR
jgi:hypothetical protein